MAVLITESMTTLEFDTLGAVKIVNFYGNITPIYSYARIYAINGGLAIGFKVFERVDIAKHKLTVSITTDESDCNLLLDICHNGEPCCILTNSSTREELSPPNISYISGDDNQGFYWGAELIIANQLLKKINLNAVSGAGFLANIILTDPTIDGYGVAFKTINDFEDFIVVPY